MKRTYSFNLVFIAVLISIYLVIGFTKILPLRPQAVHQWAQCDRASVALNFAHDTYNIFKPRVHNTANGTGITGMEFPIVNYTAGMLYRIFGFHEYLYRLLMVIMLSIGLIAAVKMAYTFLGDYLYASASVLLMFLSPVLVYYTPNFIPDTAGLGFILCAWYYFFNFRNNPAGKSFLPLVIFSSLACLIKITNLVSVSVMLLLTLESAYRSFKSNDAPILKAQKELFIYLLIPILLSVAWYWYASWLSETNNSTVFLLKQRTIENSAQFFAVMDEIRNIWFKQYYSKYMYFFIAISLVTIIVFHKKINTTIFRTTILLWVGNILFFIFMMAQFPEHDYYIISLLPAVLFQFIAFFSVIPSLLNDKKSMLSAVKILAALLVVHGVWFSRHIFHDRYDKNSWMKNDPVMDQYLNTTSTLRKLGILRDDNIISIYDQSPDISLYLMDQKGVTVADKSELKKALTAYKHQSAYLISNDQALIDDEQLQFIQLDKIGEINKLQIYKIIK